MNRMHRTLVLSLLLAVAGLSVVPEPADSQIPRRIRERAQAEAERRAEQRADEAVDRALDAVEDAIVCVVTDTECLRAAREEGREVRVTDERGTELPRDEYPPSALRPGEGAWANYDFVPGERMIFAEDFTRDNVGDFPRRLEFRRGNMEIIDWNGERLLRALSDGTFVVPLPETLPDRFTLEFDHSGGRGPGTVTFADGNHATLLFYYYRAGVRGGGIDAVSNTADRARDRIYTVRLMADGAHVKVYVDEERVANVPNANLGRSDRLVFTLPASTNRPSLLTNLRIAAGGRELYDALAADGRVVARGILFDTGSDRLRPESTPVLTDIGETLRAHPDLALRIEGHTDNVGDAAMNQALSERRAASVRQYLLDHFGIDADRLEAVGLGEAQPADTNETPEGRQNNRRVELVRI
jgi:OmpA-OmpF porin, OOP family